MTTPTEILTKAKTIIERPSAWTKGYFAKDANGDDVGEFSPYAVCWCAAGAVTFAVGDDRWESEELRGEAMGFLAEAVLEAGFPHVPAFNDHHNTTHEQVLEAFDKAIAASMFTTNATQEQA